MKDRADIEEKLLDGRTPKQYIEQVGGTWNDFIDKVNYELNIEKVNGINVKILSIKKGETPMTEGLAAIQRILNL